VNIYALIQLALAVVSDVFLKVKGGTATAEEIDRAQAALDMLNSVHGSPVTKAQLESLRVNETWLDQPIAASNPPVVEKSSPGITEIGSPVKGA